MYEQSFISDLFNSLHAFAKKCSQQVVRIKHILTETIANPTESAFQSVIWFVTSFWLGKNINYQK